MAASSSTIDDSPTRLSDHDGLHDCACRPELDALREELHQLKAAVAALRNRVTQVEYKTLSNCEMGEDATADHEEYRESQMRGSDCVIL